MDYRHAVRSNETWFCRHGLIRGWTGTDAAAHDGARLEEVLDANNTASDAWADTAYRSTKNEAMLAPPGLVLRIRQNPTGSVPVRAADAPFLNPVAARQDVPAAP